MKADRPALWLTTALVSILLVSLGQGSIASTDDALYAQMAREMASSGRWMTATWLGFEVFEKPPLLLWLLRVTGGIFGWSEFALRLPGVLGGGIALVYAYRLTTTETSNPWAGVVAVLVTLATVTFTLNTRRPMTDPLLCAAVLGSIWHTVRVVRSPTPMAASVLGVVGGLGLLAKWVAMGPVVLACGVALMAHRRWHALGLALLAALVVASPWFIWMTVTHGGEFWDVFLGYHVVNRAEGALVGAAPATVYMETLWALDGVLGLVLMVGLGVAAVLRRSVLMWLVVGSAVVTLVAIHLASTRLYHYLMPVVPLAGVATASLCARRRESLIGLALLGIVGFVAGPLDPTILRPDFAPASKAIGEALRQAPSDATVVSWEDYDPALTWYAQRPVRIWTQSEQMVAIQESIDMMRRAQAVVFASPERLRDLTAGPGPVFFVAPRARADGLMAWIQTLPPSSVRVDRDTASSHFVVVLEPRT